MRAGVCGRLQRPANALYASAGFRSTTSPSHGSRNGEPAMKTTHLSNPRTPQLADAAGESLLYRVRWELSGIPSENQDPKERVEDVWKVSSCCCGPCLAADRLQAAGRSASALAEKREAAAEPVVREFTVPAVDVTLHARMAGDPKAGNVLIAINGGPGLSSHYMLGLEDLVGPDFAVVTYDQRGVSRSARRRWIPPTIPGPSTWMTWKPCGRQPAWRRFTSWGTRGAAWWRCATRASILSVCARCARE